MPRKKILPEEI
jgi:hypothetical protein